MSRPPLHFLFFCSPFFLSFLSLFVVFTFLLFLIVSVVFFLSFFTLFRLSSRSCLICRIRWTFFLCSLLVLLKKNKTFVTACICILPLSLSSSLSNPASQLPFLLQKLGCFGVVLPTPTRLFESPKSLDLELDTSMTFDSLFNSLMIMIMISRTLEKISFANLCDAMR